MNGEIEQNQDQNCDTSAQDLACGNQTNESPTNPFFIKTTYSQSGEDSIIAYILKMLGIPFENMDYIDLGANHAKEMSNTYYFYEQGAKGILVEANPLLIPELEAVRQRDSILNFCVDIESGKDVEFFILSGDGLSTTDHAAALQMCEVNPEICIVESRKLQTISYTEIVELHLGKAPTLLSIDIEGDDQKVLKSIAQTNYRPLIIVTEVIGYDTRLAYHTKDVETINFMKSINYDEYAFTGINSIFVDRDQLQGR